MDNKRKLHRIILYFSFGLIFLITMAYLLWELKTLLLPITLGALLAYLFKPLLTSIKFSWIPKKLKVTLILLTIIIGISFLYKLVKSQFPSPSEQIELMVRIQYKLNEKYNSLMEIDQKTGKGNMLHSLVSREASPILEQINYWLILNKKQQAQFTKFYKTAEEPLKLTYYGYFLANLKNFYKNNTLINDIEHKIEDENSVDSSETSFLAKLLNTLSTWLVLPFVFIFLLFDNGQIQKYFISLVPNRYFELSLTVFDEVDQALGKYLRGTILECSLVGFTLSAGLFLIGFDIKVSLIIGLIAGLTNAIPFLGPAIGLIVGLAYALVVEQVDPYFPFITKENITIGVLLAVLVAQFLDNTIYQPIVLGNAVNLHPLVVIVGVMGGSTIFGFAGMLLAIPTIVIIKVVVETLFRELKSYRIV